VRIVMLGAGFAGLELTSLLSEEFGESIELTLIDKAEHFILGFSKLDVMFGRETADAVAHPYADIVKPGVRFVSAEVTAIDPVTRHVTTTAGEFDSDVLVIGLGADLHPEATPGLVEAGNEFYTVAGAFALREVLANFTGGNIVVAVTSTPFKCPPAPSETALLLHDMLIDRGLAEVSKVSLVMPLPLPIPPSPQASESLLAEFARRGIEWLPNRLVRGLDGDRKVALVSEGDDIPFDLFLGVPMHRAPDVVVSSGLAVDGWIQVDPHTLQTSFDNVYAVGDVTSIGTPKAGVFAEGQAVVVASRIASQLRGEEPDAAYDGHGLCYLEFGHDAVAKVDVTFKPGQPPYGSMIGPSPELVADKVEFGRSRIARWFGAGGNQPD
jgi:sulfide:quinone oxidoreductase